MLYKRDFYVSPKKEKIFFGKAKLQIMFTIGLLTLALVFGQLVFANNLATDGERLSKIEDEISQLEAENMSIRMEIAKKSSLTNLSQKAEKIGYLRAKVISK